MATVNTLKANVQESFAAVKKAQCLVDCAELNLASANVYKLFDIEAGWHVHGVGVKRITAEGDTLTADIGAYLASNDSAVDADGFLDGIDLNATGIATSWTHTVTDDVASPAWGPAGKTFTADSWLGLAPSAAADAAKFIVEMYYSIIGN